MHATVTNRLSITLYLIIFSEKQFTKLNAILYFLSHGSKFLAKRIHEVITYNNPISQAIIFKLKSEVFTKYQNRYAVLNCNKKTIKFHVLTIIFDN